MTDGWGEWKQRMLLPLQENPILSISRKINYTVWIRTASRSHLMTCRDALHAFCLCVILFLPGWNLVSSEYSLEFEEYVSSRVLRVVVSLRESYISLMIVPVHVMSRIHQFNMWLSNQISLSNWNHSFKNHYNLKWMVWVENNLSKSKCCAKCGNLDFSDPSVCKSSKLEWK